MIGDAIPRYQATYRADEMDLIIRFALRGESLGFLGLAGSGKSNMVNFLRDIQNYVPQIGPHVERLHFPVVDASYWQRTPDSLWKMMLDALNQVTKGLTPPSTTGNKIIPISEEERLTGTLNTRLKWLCQELKHQVMFIFDDFDIVFETGPLEMLERLNGLRSEGNREALSYGVFTKRLPHVLGRSYQLEHKSKFYDLFRHHIYALEPYSAKDAFQMLRHLNDIAGNPLRDKDLAQIRQLGGGHARLLKIVFDIWVNEGASGVNPITYFASKPDVQQECRRILLNLHQQEQEVARLMARGQHTTEHQDTIDHLVRRGLLVKLDPVTWFSPLLAQFLSTDEK